VFSGMTARIPTPETALGGDALLAAKARRGSL
jgi:hypothetical protein